MGGSGFDAAAHFDKNIPRGIGLVAVRRPNQDEALHTLVATRDAARRTLVVCQDWEGPDQSATAIRALLLESRFEDVGRMMPAETLRVFQEEGMISYLY